MSGLVGFKEDRRNSATGVHPINYGAYSSHGPTHDSTFANLTKAETELVYSTYGDDIGVGYAESIKNFSKSCEYANFIVDSLLDILTGTQHSKTTKHIEEQKLLREEEQFVSKTFKDETIDFDTLKSLENDGIDVSFLDSLQKNYSESVDVRLAQTANLIENLRDTQNERLSSVPSSNIGETLQAPTEKEHTIVDQIEGNLKDLVGSNANPCDLGVNSSNFVNVKKNLLHDIQMPKYSNSK